MLGLPVAWRSRQPGTPWASDESILPQNVTSAQSQANHIVKNCIFRTVERQCTLIRFALSSLYRRSLPPI